MNTEHRFWILNGLDLFLTAPTLRWARIKVAAFSFMYPNLRIIDWSAVACRDAMEVR